ncbi:PHD finger-containing protein 1-like isoform X4 [Silene latifolia]|uniref:PHD finger-containing protein 1-like isoform X4 n=1 Tax=Silene latifolia TaxID=37657 RepID=UPI003D773BD2
MADPPPNNLHMDKPCEICGSTGYAECIIVCHRCKITSEHMYCMRIVHQGDPEHWVCEECKSGDQTPTPKLVSSKQPSDVTTRFNIRKPPRNTKVQYIPPEEAMVLESGAQKKNLLSPSKSNLSCKTTANRIFASRTEASRSTTIPPKLCAKRNTPEIPPGFTNLQSTRSLPNTLQDKKLPASKDTEKCMVQKQRDRQDSSSVIGLSAKKAQTTNAYTEEKNKGPPRRLYANKDTSAGMAVHLEKCLKSNAELGSPTNVGCKSQAVENLEHASVQSVDHLPTVSSGLGVCVDAQSENFGSDGKKPSRVALDLDKYLINHPAEIPTWKGRINITHTDDILHCRSFDGIQAHPPCKVHRKVYDLSRQLPEALQVELLPRLNFWTSLFEDDSPGALDIGLYFLSPKGSEQNLTSLLEFLDEHDMLLRSEIDGVELLFMSSRHLPKDSQRINQTFFLWGLFRSAEKAVIAETGEESGEDMDIDMSGGHEVGIIDKVISKLAETPEQGHTVVDVIPIEKGCRDGASPILRDCSDSASPILTSVTSFFEKQLDFEGDLQRSLDKFLMLK